ncbi:MAG: phage tail assembly protein [Clostridiaceae bacterium]|nr:phage tail assembly protein [Clostridiaceae bacterium]
MTIVVEEMTLELLRPIKLEDRSIEMVNLREPTAYEIEQVSKKAESSAQGSNILLVSLVSGLTVGEVGKMGIRDLNQALKFLQGFIEAGQETGKP